LPFAVSVFAFGLSFLISFFRFANDLLQSMASVIGYAIIFFIGYSPFNVLFIFFWISALSFSLVAWKYKKNKFEKSVLVFYFLCLIIVFVFVCFWLLTGQSLPE